MINEVAVENVTGNKESEKRLFDRASNMLEKPDFTGYNTDVLAVNMENNDARAKIVEELLKEKEGVPAHLQDADTLDAHLLGEHLRSKDEALKAQNAVLGAAEESKEGDGWLSKSLTTVKNGFNAVGSHIMRNKWKYVALAAAAGLGWYFSGYIIPWLNELRAIVPQNAIDQAAAAGVEAAPVVNPVVAGAPESELLNQVLVQPSVYPDPTALQGATQLIQGAAPAAGQGGVATGSNVLSAFR